MYRRPIFLVTGGSRGIGAAIAQQAARHYPVAILYRSNSDEAARVVASIEREGGGCTAIQCDVGDEMALMDAFEQLDLLGRVGVLVNNAAITGGLSRVRDVSAQALSEVLRVNVQGAFLAAREAVRRMSTAAGGEGGVIINVSSGASVLGSPNHWVHYAASKGAIDTMTIGLSKEVAAEGIRVNAVRPGLVDTDIQAGRSPQELARMTAAIPLGRMASADEIANAVLWLASPAAAYVTGALLDVRGGF
ncbi:SDR family oxidoreductase [Bordetella petrii]|uniref:SDR family oxidoreductase n=1 Tax=Bordetella petrii TaxID=94624 RepID=UPI00047D4DE3|nr:SDR family oxidoreductase [Bordetella petrii]